MSEQYFPDWQSEPELRETIISITGTGAATPTLNYGRGLVVGFVSTGLYEITYSESPGNFVGFNYGFWATTASALKGYSCVLAPINTATLKQRFSITDNTDTLANLAVLQNLTINLQFKKAGITV